MCGTNSKVSRLFLLAGILFLLVDLDIWGFWGLNWWTIVLLIIGLARFGSAGCKDGMEPKRKKK